MENIQNNNMNMNVRFENINASITGIITGIKTIPAQFTDVDIVTILDENNISNDVMITAGMKSVDFKKLIDKKVKITYTGNRISKFGREYKNFRVDKLL